MSFDEDRENMTISSEFDVSDFLEERRRRKEGSPRRLIPALEDYVRRHFLPERSNGQPSAAQTPEMMMGAPGGIRPDAAAGTAGNVRPDAAAEVAGNVRPDVMMGSVSAKAMKARAGMAVDALRNEAAKEATEKTPPKKKSFGLFRKSAEKPTLLPISKNVERAAKRSAVQEAAPFEEDYEGGLKAEEADLEPCEAEWDIEAHETAINERMTHLSDTYQQYLFYLIESKGMSNAEVYKRAIVDKKVFAKIKANPDYHPKKMTALCLCVGAKLNLDETRDLLARAGYALSPCDKTDVIFSYFIENEIYDMIEIDIQLEEHGLPCIIA